MLCLRFTAASVTAVLQLNSLAMSRCNMRSNFNLNILDRVPIRAHLRPLLCFSVARMIRIANIISRGGKYRYHSLLSTYILARCSDSITLLREPSCSRHTSAAVHSFIAMRNVPHAPQVRLQPFPFITLYTRLKLFPFPFYLCRGVNSL
jgi:hypothetical protein